MHFYTVPPIADERNPRLQQGDLLFPFPFPVFTLKEAYIIPPAGTEPQAVNLYTPDDLASLRVHPLPDGSQIIASIQSGIGIVVNQTCDLSMVPGRAKPILVARVDPCISKISKFNDKSIKAVTGVIKELANPGRAPNLFYLPAFANDAFSIPPSVADLLRMVCLPPGDLEGLAILVKLRLTVPAIQAFQERLTYCFGRFGAPDDLYFSEEEWQYMTAQQTMKQQDSGQGSRPQ